MKHVILASLFSVAACATAKTTEPTGPKPATPTIMPPLDTLAFYVGEWSCKGTQFATKDQKEEHWDARVLVAPELDGSWFSVQMIGPGTNRTVEHKGYDKATKKWIHIAVGLEGSWAAITSPGWDGTKMVFVSEDKADHTLTTFTRIDEHHYSHAVANDAEHGGERLWEKLCSKG